MSTKMFIFWYKMYFRTNFECPYHKTLRRWLIDFRFDQYKLFSIKKSLRNVV
jgi:hypothetical protein